MITLQPIADATTVGWTHTGSGDFYEDVDEGPDSADADSVGFVSAGSPLGRSIVFTVKTDGLANVTWGLLRIRGENTAPDGDIAVDARVFTDNVNAPQFSGVRATLPAGSVVELPLWPQVSVPLTYADYIQLSVSGLLDASASFTIEAVELILYQGDEPSAARAGFFLHLCGFP